VTLPQWEDEGALLAELGAALAEARAVPPEFAAVGEATFAWRTVDAELMLAELLFDSAVDQGLPVRSGHGSTRSLAFGGAGVTIEIEVGPTGIVGQVSPPSDGQIVCQTVDGDCGAAQLDEVGLFVLPAPPSGPIRLRASTAGYRLATSWVRVG
jgi:hypothetical protein